MVRFDPFELDEGARELRREGSPVHLEPQAFDVLVHLVRNRDRVVTKEELLDEVWGHHFVSESALTTRIKEVRRALDDDGTRQAAVANVRGRGYRFVATVTGTAAGTDRSGAPGAPGATGSTGRAPGATGSTGSGLIGRETDVEGVLSRLAGHGLVTIVGAGGVGKTVLADAVARRWRTEQGRPALVVALAELDDPESVVPALAEAMGVMADRHQGRGLAEAVAARDDLVVLDNCEHVLDAVAATVAELLGSGGGLRVLATSRERLGLGAEQVWPLLPLFGDDARALFLSRAAAGGTAVDPDDPLVDRVVHALDGLPLALEMAAAQLAVMTGDDLEELIGDDAELLRSPDRSAPSRHRSLGAVVRWSLALLGPPERELLADLSIFAAPMTAADATAVVEPGGGRTRRVAMAADLAQLASRSLLAAETERPTARYRMPETVRSVVGADLPAARRTALAARHADHFLEVARSCDRELRGPSEVVGHERLTDAIPELRAAYRWAHRHAPALVVELSVALHLYAYSRLWAEPAQWARAEVGTDDPVLVSVLAADAANRSRIDEASELAARAMRSDDPRAVAIGLEVAADAELYRGRLREAEDLAQRLHQLGVATNDDHLQVVGLVNVALSRSYRDEPEAAASAVEQLRQLEPGLGPSDQGWCDYVDGEVSAGSDPAASLLALQRAIDLAEVAGNRLLASVARTSLATGLFRAGERDAAIGAFTTCVREAIAHGNSTHAATTLRNLVDVVLAAGDEETATILLGALDVEGVKTTYGAEARRVEAARSVVGSGPAAASIDDWLRRGAEQGLDGALVLASRWLQARAGS